jgi:hypothetical protein
MVVLGCLLGSVVVEAGYRVILYHLQPKRFHLPARGQYFGAYNVSHWEFDEQFGYVYPPGRVIAYTGVGAGRVTGCDRLNVMNKEGNIGPIVGNYREAALKILVFGDSWAAFHQKDAAGRERTWPLFLQDVLTARLGKPVHVVNFGRDGYGILQMFDLAAAKIPEWKPDLAIITFITDDLKRARFWRTVVGEGAAMRVLTTLEPVRNPRTERAADTYLLMPSATYEWCRGIVGTDRTDPVLDALIEKHRRLLSNNSPRQVADIFTVRHSYLYNLVSAGDPFHFVWKRIRPAVLPQVTFDDFGKDARLLQDIERINATGIPWVLFHLAFYPEINARREYILDRQRTALLESLEKVTARKVLRTTDYVAVPVPDLERIKASPEDFHPSVWGMEFYAKAVAEGLLRQGLVPSRNRAMPSSGRMQ